MDERATSLGFPPVCSHAWPTSSLAQVHHQTEWAVSATRAVYWFRRSAHVQSRLEARPARFLTSGSVYFASTRLKIFSLFSPGAPFAAAMCQCGFLPVGVIALWGFGVLGALRETDLDVGRVWRSSNILLARRQGSPAFLHFTRMSSLRSYQ